jgi:glycerate kinase
VACAGVYSSREEGGQAPSFFEIFEKVAYVKTILIAPDSFKGSLIARDAAAAIERGVKEVLPDSIAIQHPISDGGEGLVDILTTALQGTFVTSEVQGPLPGQRVKARWGLSEDRSTAIIEMAEAAGLGLVPEDKRDPKITTTYGVGELIRAALDAGASSLVIGIGGSATNDGGAGMAQALGVRFLDGNGKPLAGGGAALAKLGRIDVQKKDPRLGAIKVIVASDVQNILCGEQGASAVFGPQKGATSADVKILDAALLQYGQLVRSTLGIDVLHIRGSGAAGGLGAGLVAFCDAVLKRGIDVVLEATKFDDHLRAADLVITGEGRIDEQVRFGKALSGVIERANRAGVPVLAIAGSLEGDRSAFVSPAFLLDLESLVDSHTTPEMAMRNASTLLSKKTGVLLRRYLNPVR